MLAEIDAEIAKLQTVRGLLSGPPEAVPTPAKGKRAKKTSRTMSAESRQKIKDAQRLYLEAKRDKRMGF